MNCVERSCRALPVRPKRVLTSPTAVPASAKDVGMVVAISLAMFSMDSSASPVAPVLVTMVSMPSSTSEKAAREAAPTAAIGAVTFFVIVSPTPLILSPTAETLLPASFSVAEMAESVFLVCVSRFFSSSSVAIISRFQASYCCWVTEPFFRPSSIWSCTDFSSVSFPLVSSTACESRRCF